MRRNFVHSIVSCLLALAIVCPAGVASAVEENKKGSKVAKSGTHRELSGADIFLRCGDKNPGRDQRSRFIVLLRNRSGQVKRSEYLRLWKDFSGRDGVEDKMILYNILPNEARGAGFLRIARSGEQFGRVDQFIYLPALRKIRRVSIRDPGDSFLNSNLTYADVGKRAIKQDEHRFLGVRQLKGKDFYVVESVPREAKPLYGKRIFWFLKTPSWEDCVNTRIDYFDQQGNLIKDQFIKWQHVGDAWIWDRVLVRSRTEGTGTVFQITDVQVDTGLDDALFTVRSLKKGLAGLPEELKTGKRPSDGK